ncbi:hypothetical protein [Marinobacter guineae]|uniref:hypothetical protein n=1 Tax=Marinobacter guineae TaxID=432303 RepID=UPI001474A171|nr:hypothetical protein [Marinobacter guineae]
MEDFSRERQLDDGQITRWGNPKTVISGFTIKIPESFNADKHFDVLKGNLMTVKSGK